jgi:hypothetical protein
MLYRCATAYGWTTAQTLGHTLGELVALIQQDRLARGEPAEGSVATAAEERRFLRRFRRDTPQGTHADG